MNDIESAGRSSSFVSDGAPKFSWAAGWLLLALAFGLRTIFLEWKPPHFDESINGWFIAQMWKQGYYRYDPTNFHGPLYFYVLQVAELLMGRSVFTLRFITALISTGLVGVVLLHGRWFGRVALWAAILLAVSPAMVFYGRYAIHESLFVLSQAIFSYGFLRWKIEGGRTAVVCMAAGVVGSIGTKETFFIFFGTWFIAWGLVHLYERFRGLKPQPAMVRSKRQRSKAAAANVPEQERREPVGRAFVIKTLLVSILIVLALFSGFFMNLQGIRDMVTAFAPWLKTGMGATGHEKPFMYWIELMARYEWPVLGTLALAPLLALHRSRWAWQFAATGFGLWLAYSIIPYKTPWCLLGYIWPLSLAFGFMIEFAREKFPFGPRLAVRMAAVATLAVSFAVTIRLNFRDYTNVTEPYVYVQTTNDVTRFMGQVEARVQQFPEDRNMSFMVMNKDPWPFPWLLGTYPGLAYGRPEGTVEIAADVVLIDGPAAETVEPLLRGVYLKQPLQIRDSYSAGWAYFRLEKFRNILPSDSQVIGGGTPGEAP